MATPGFVITSAGLDAALLANEKGFKVEIAKFSLGSAYGYIPTSEDAGLKGDILYSAPPTSFQYKGDHTIMITCIVPATAGPFDFGEIGLYMEDGTLFALASWEQLVTKYSNLESDVSSTMTFYCYLTIAQGAASITISYEENPTTVVEIIDIMSWKGVTKPSDMQYDVPELIIHEESPAGDSTLLIRTDDDRWTVASTYRQEFVNLELVTSTTTYVEVACDGVGQGVTKYHASDISGKYLMSFSDGTFEAFEKAQYLPTSNRLRLTYKVPVDVAKERSNQNHLYIANNYPSVITLESLQEGITWNDVQNKPTSYEGYGLVAPSNEIGAISFYPVTNIPSGKLICQGQELSRTNYPRLFAVIGSTYGGNGSTTFKLPDLRGYFPRFWDGGRGIDTGRGVGTTQTDGAPNIWGTFDGNVDDGASVKTGAFYDTGSYFNGSNGQKHGGILGFNASRCSAVYGRANEIRPKNIALVGVITYA